ncbi:MAG: thioredoxin domain-containing protein [Candidatus Omnitrophica bacterium]|nr:thioredoxin domain-containing protein [Candidatus Omnitrophota bacterium]
MGEAKRRRKRVWPLRKITGIAVRVMIVAVCILAVIDFIARRNVSVLDNPDPLRTVGDPQASVQIIQFVDFQNPEVSRGAKVLDRFLKKHRQDMYVLTRYYVTPDRNSLISALHAECASRQGLFWPYYEELLLKQQQWRTSRDAGPYLTLLARNMSADMEMFTSCVGDIEVKQAVEEDTRLGESHGIHSVPTYFVNDRRFSGVDELEKYLSEYFENKRLGLL